MVPQLKLLVLRHSLTAERFVVLVVLNWWKRHRAVTGTAAKAGKDDSAVTNFAHELRPQAISVTQSMKQ